MRENKYEKTLKYLFGLEKFGMVFGLDNIRWLLELVENPASFYKDSAYRGYQRERFHGNHAHRYSERRGLQGR